MFVDEVAWWGLTPDGEPIVTRSGRLLPVRYRGEAAVLKVAVEAEERRGGALMAWWGGDGAARVYARHGEALLLERAVGSRSLAAMARDDQDDEASRIVCAVASRLHAGGHGPRPPDLVPLTGWFAALGPGAREHGGRYPELVVAAAIARELLDDQHDVVPLHGDIHHGNILDAGPRGWLAIDPKGLVGERGFDLANLLRNPDPAVATRPGRLARQADVISAAADLDRDRLLRWVVALCGLSAAWHLADGVEPRADLVIAALALAELT